MLVVVQLAEGGEAGLQLGLGLGVAAEVGEAAAEAGLRQRHVQRARAEARLEDAEGLALVLDGGGVVAAGVVDLGPARHVEGYGWVVVPQRVADDPDGLVE